VNDKLIEELRAGDLVVSFFVIRRKEIRTKRDSAETYLSLELADRSGRIGASIWEDSANPDLQFDELRDALQVGDVVKVQGKVVSYRDRLYLNVERLRKSTEADSIDFTRLVPTSERDPEEMWSELERMVASVESMPLRQLLKQIFSNPEIKQRFMETPGGKQWHHAYVGGLLEHTLAVTAICDRLASLYDGVDRDLLVTAALLHDIGKIRSYQTFPTFDFTDEGRLLGHIVIGSQMVAESIGRIGDFPEEMAKQLQHLILSHQGKLEQASPVVPMTLEALILYYADELDSKANAFLRIRKREKRPGTRWSSYVNLIARHLYFGE
jgi:3'-5' exoribonuclease